MTTPAPVIWGERIVVETIGGVPMRMYAQRPRRVESLLAFAERWDDRAHIVQGERIVSFLALRNAIAAKSRELLALGVKDSERVLILGWNSPEWIVNFWACVCAGAVPVLANAWWSHAEVAAAVALLQPALTLADDSAAGKIPIGSRHGRWRVDLAPGPVALPDRTVSDDEEHSALIIFTSGTSGQAKAVVLSHRAVLARLHMTLHVTRKLPHQVNESAHDVTLITGPLFHVGGMQTLLRAVMTGDTLVFPRGRFDAGEALELIERHQVKRWNAVPTMVSRLLDHPDLSRRDLASLRSISVGGAPVRAELLQRIRTRLPKVSPRIPTGYGLTENAGQATASGGSERLEQLGSSGRPMPCVEVNFLRHAGIPEDEILLRSPTQMSGYFGLAESPIDAEGWLHTGDLGRLDENGNLWITGRLKDMIIRGGENIAPAAIESALLSIPGVADAAVIGVPHPDLGEEVMAIVVIEQETTAQQLADALRDRVASFAVPSRWRIQKEPLPTNDTGKIDKPALSAQVRIAIGGESTPAA
jgi:acyl-CoA synthetase (AMP-forming)/AMP-acid ligase II